MSDSDEVGFVILSVFGAVIYSLWRLIKKGLGHGIDEEEGEEDKREEKKGGSKGFVKRDFFVKSLTRRRRLDLTRKRDNLLSGKLGKKLDRHRRGMFGK